MIIFSSYTCSDRCVDWRDMCQGVSFCYGDEAVCGENLRCPKLDAKDEDVEKRRLNTVTSRSICVKDKNIEILNNGSYDLIDRSDEQISKKERKERINYPALENCTIPSFADGVYCNQPSCVPNFQWCSKSQPNDCIDSGVKTNDAILCSNHTFWQNVNISCDIKIGPKIYKGERCRGAIKHCYYPEGTPWPTFYPSTCRDKSDRVFVIGELCDEKPGSICWESCDRPGPNCTKCSNSSYIRCPLSNKCIDPSLRCDGHPQCDQGEDEFQCLRQYQENKMTPEHATFRCKSIMYPELETYAIACDGFPECFGNIDENGCDSNKSSKIVVFLAASIAFIYLVLKYGRRLVRFIIRKVRVKNGHKVIMNRQKTETIHLDDFATSPDNSIEELNAYLLHIIFTKPTDEAEEICKKVYQIEERKYNGNTNEIFCSLHTKLDPLLMQNIIYSQFRGLVKKTIEFIENLTFRAARSLHACCKGEVIENYSEYRWITAMFDYIKENEWLADLLGTLSRLVKIEIQYLDILKDSFLVITLFHIIGGYQVID